MSVPPAIAAAPDVTGADTPGIVTSFAPIVEKDLPAVANISSSKVVKGNGNQMSPFFMDPFFRQFFGDNFGRQFQQPRQRERALGSGVIVRPDGYLLTNNHVIDGATEITVTLLDRREFKAKLVGTDSRTDIAVLKVDASNLPTLAFADSSKVRVGDVALAMGQPFGLGQTVTMGIISAKGRNGLNIEGYEDFIQTDAAINPGNSGGALVDVRGNLIGINTAILSHGSGGNEGIGFAIPANMARNVMNQVMAHGKVVRGYMGVLPEDITPAMAKALRLTDVRGVLMGDVTAGSPAAQAGLQRGDVVTEIDGERVEDGNQLRLKISMLAPGTVVNLRVIRDGSARTIPVKLIEYPNETAQNRQRDNGNAGSTALDGVSVDELDSQTLRQLGLPPTTRGVVVTNVADGSPASVAGLERGDVIQEIDHVRITSVGDYNRAVGRAMGHTMLLLVNRQGNTRYIAVEPQ
ncbi:MAG TPA: DegQ family serine endoprotease [Bryobacteraceae bacterium]|nr:DegQ family serine endoprotease [Bryobacteraceae bacterium]